MHREAVASSFFLASAIVFSAILVRLNWDTPQRAVAIAVAVSASGTALAAATGRRTLKVSAAVALGAMITFALTRPSGMVGAWVVVAVLFFCFAARRPSRSRTNASEVRNHRP